MFFLFVINKKSGTHLCITVQLNAHASCVDVRFAGQDAHASCVDVRFAGQDADVDRLHSCPSGLPTI